MNSKQFITATLAATLMTSTYTVAAECDDDGDLVKTVYLMQASNDYHPVQVNDKSQGKHKQNNASNRSDKDDSTDDSAWYKPWSWRNDSPDNDDANNRNNQNSNRQSDPDSTRGQERAAERRAEKDNPKNDSPWYDPRGWFD